MSRARTSRSNTAGRRIKTIGCRCWQRPRSASGGRDRHEWGRAAFAAKAATATIPIVFVVGEDPVEAWSCRQPRPAGGNITGVIILDGAGGEAAGAPARVGARGDRVAVLVNPANAAQYRNTHRRKWRRRPAPSGCKSSVLNASTDRDIDTVFATIATRAAARS